MLSARFTYIQSGKAIKESERKQKEKIERKNDATLVASAE